MLAFLSCTVHVLLRIWYIFHSEKFLQKSLKNDSWANIPTYLLKGCESRIKAYRFIKSFIIHSPFSRRLLKEAAPSGNSMLIKWLGFHALTVKDPGLMPSWLTIKFHKLCGTARRKKGIERMNDSKRKCQDKSDQTRLYRSNKAENFNKDDSDGKTKN